MGRARIGLLCAIALFLALLGSQAAFVPVWDGRIYADCAVSAANHFRFEALRCGDHPTHGYVFWLALVQLLSPGSYPLMLATNAVLGAAGVFAFDRIVQRALPAPERGFERAALTVAFAIHPTFVASALQINPDFGATVFLLVSLASLLEGRIALATAAGLFLTFSKEPGAALYVILVALYAVVFITRSERAVREKLALLRPLLPLVLPTLAMATYLLVRAATPRTNVLWLGAPASELILRVFSFNPRSEMLWNYLVLLFIGQFFWVPSAFLLIDAAVGASRFLFRAEARPIDGERAPLAALLPLLAFFTVLLVTRVPLGTNPRYLLPAYPLLLLAFGLSLRRLRLRTTSGRAAAGLTAALLFVSNFATLDPLSRGYFGTFEFGRHRMLNVLRYTRLDECCEYGRDQLVYNLEFTAVHYLQNQMLEDLRPTAETPLAVDARAEWFLVEDLDPVTFHRTLRRANTIRPRVIDVTRDKLGPDRFFASSGVTLASLPKLPTEVFYLSLPNVEDGQALEILSASYVEVSRKEYHHHGYTGRLHRLSLKPKAGG